MAYMTSLNATQAEIDAYTGEIDAFVEKLLAGAGESVSVSIAHSCTFQNDISLNYYVSESDLTDYTNVFLYIERETYIDGVLTKVTEIIKEYTVTDGNYRFVYQGIAACEMGDVLNATVYAMKDGSFYESELDTYSVMTYAYNRLAASEDTVFKTMLVDMLNYG